MSLYLILSAIYFYLCAELFSCFHMIKRGPVLVEWLLWGVFTVFCVYKKLGKNNALRSFGIIFLIFIWVSGFVLALITTPYNWDSMTYHLPRVMHWIQNESIAHYATNCTRQIGSPIFAELMAMYTYIITGSDRFIPLIQSVAHGLCAIYIYRISKKIIGTENDNGLCYVASGVYLLMPIAFAESISTHNDILATLWVLAFVDIILPYLMGEKEYTDPGFFRDTTVAGLAVGLCYLTKSSAVFACGILAVTVLVVLLIKKCAFPKILGASASAVVAAFLTVLPELYRNIITFSGFAPSSVGQRQLIGTLNPKYVLINFLKNFVYNMSTPLIPLGKISAKVVKILASLLNVNIDDPLIAEDGRMFIAASPLDFGHDTAINALVMWLFLISFVVWIIVKVKSKKKNSSGSKAYIIGACVSWTVFLTIVRWEPFETRYEIPYFALLCPVIAYFLWEIVEGKKKGVVAILSVVTALAAASWIGLLAYHGEIAFRADNDRPRGYFYYGGYDEYADITEFIKAEGYSDVGLKTHDDTWEYQIWMMLKDSSVERIEHVAVMNESAIYEDETFVPDCIISVDAGLEQLELGGHTYVKVKDEMFMALFVLE